MNLIKEKFFLNNYIEIMYYSPIPGTQHGAEDPPLPVAQTKV